MDIKVTNRWNISRRTHTYSAVYRYVCAPCYKLHWQSKCFCLQKIHVCSQLVAISGKKTVFAHFSKPKRFHQLISHRWKTPSMHTHTYMHACIRTHLFFMYIICIKFLIRSLSHLSTFRRSVLLSSSNTLCSIRIRFAHNQ